MIIEAMESAWASGSGPTRRRTRPIVVSIYAPRIDKFGVDYDDCLDVLQASCDRLGLRHVCISDEKRPRVETFVCDLPQNVMQMILSGQLQWLRHTNEPTFFVGADCIVTRDPTDICLGYDLGITTEDYDRVNTGAMWCNTKACVPIWEAALAKNPVEWGDDQRVFLEAVREAGGLKVRELPMSAFNSQPTEKHARSNIWNPPMVVHFKGKRKHLMRDWWSNFLWVQSVIARETA